MTCIFWGGWLALAVTVNDGAFFFFFLHGMIRDFRSELRFCIYLLRENALHCLALRTPVLLSGVSVLFVGVTT